MELFGGMKIIVYFYKNILYMDYKDIIDNFESSSRAEEIGLLYLGSRHDGMTTNVKNTEYNSLQYPCSFTEEEIDVELVHAESNGYVRHRNFYERVGVVGYRNIK